MYKVTKKDFEVFKAEAQKWVKAFGLFGWEIHYDYDEDNDCRASCTSNKEAMLSIIALSREWPAYKPKRTELKKIAFHEVCELLLAKFRLLAEDRYVNENELESERHAIIRVLEHLIFNNKE